MVKFYELAREEWSDLAGTDLRFVEPSFRWVQPAGLKAQPLDGATTLFVAWRALARRAHEVALHLGKRRPHSRRGRCSSSTSSRVSRWLASNLRCRSDSSATSASLQNSRLRLPSPFNGFTGE